MAEIIGVEQVALCIVIVENLHCEWAICRCRTAFAREIMATEAGPIIALQYKPFGVFRCCTCRSIPISAVSRGDVRLADQGVFFGAI